MSGVKSLAKDTAVYGISSIVGRVLNYLLVPFYTNLLAPGEYGTVSTLYSYTGVLLVVLNYGMETGFFRFVNKSENPQTVYTTTLISIGSTSLLFICIISIFLNPISTLIKMSNNRLFVWIMGITVSIDAFTNIPFAYLRYAKKAKRFATIKFVNIIVNIGLNVLFLLVCPLLDGRMRSAINWFYDPREGATFSIGCIFLANLLATIFTLFMLLPELRGLKWKFDGLLLKKMLNFSYSILITGVAGTFAHNMGQILIPYIYSGESGEKLVGIYSANIKIAVILTMFTQAFRYAYEPFIFSNAGSDIKGRNKAYCDAMKYFVIFSLLIFMSVMFFLPIIQYFVGAEYRSGLDIVPIVMGAEICFGIYFNLSIWYKLTDKTIWGTVFSIISFIVMAGLNVVLVRKYGETDGYVGSAWASLISYALIMILCWFVGQRYFPLNYPIKRILAYTVIAIGFIAIGEYFSNIVIPISGWSMKIKLIVIYILIVIRIEKLPIHSILKAK